MKSKVYLLPVSQSDAEESVGLKLRALIENYGVLSAVKAGDKAVLKIHFGEQGNTGYVRPAYAAVIAKAVLEARAVPVISDSNTLYRGRRMNSADHLKLAYEHGFTPDVLKAPVVIPDDALPENVRNVDLDAEHVKTAAICRLYSDADAIIGIAHFKGHLMTGFGGAIKNIGMGCATRKGKLFQHSDLAPIVVIRKCTGCKACMAVCPSAAITMKNNMACVDVSKCIGCASCIAACRFKAVDLNWEAGGMRIQEKMAEYAKAVLLNKKGKTAFFNFLTKITGECDCIARDDPRIIADIGILASADPVAIDQASLDLVTARAGSDILKQIHPNRDAQKQLAHAEKIGIGSREYDLEMVL